MPGTPPETPNFGIPRSADSDTASFSEQVNAISDTVDAKAVLTTDSRLDDERVPEDGSVTASKIPSGTITEAHLADETIVHQPGDVVVSIASARAGCLLCDGTAYSRTTYAALFAAVGTAYGVGDGHSTFNVPDFRGRVVVGGGTGPGLTPRPLGQTGGEETHLLTGDESGVQGHEHYLSGATGTGSDYSNSSVPGNNGVSADAIVETSSSTGGGVPSDALTAHNTMPPYGVANVFVKY